MAHNPAFQDEFYTCCYDEEKSQLMVLKDKQALCEDLKYILSVPDLCDITFLVGPEQYPIHGLRAILASRSRLFYMMILAKEKEIKIQASQKKIGFFEEIERNSMLTIVLEEFEPNIFETGLLNAAEKFELECLKNACWEFAVSCIRPDLVHDLIASANEYSNCKLTNDLFKEIQEISLNHPELLFCTPRSRSNSFRDGNDRRPKSITTNGLLMRSVL
ncbi:unnamed protein product [Mytilus edulis]|uniref:BTB domain-containing protein n=1 Tax=Mytilus edulis TaxID=6550 RepID=A0A8S3VBP0_MYTED|nr:unnamed protein product [Mytilus edulis]